MDQRPAEAFHPWLRREHLHGIHDGASFLFGKGVQHAANFVQFFARSRLRRQGAHHQASGRTAERAFQQVARDLLLGLLLRDAGLVNVRSETLAADEQTLLRHQLHLLQRGGVAVVFAELRRGLPVRSPAPASRGRLECRVRRRLEVEAVAMESHLKRRYYDKKRMSTIIIVIRERQATRSPAPQGRSAGTGTVKPGLNQLSQCWSN